MRTYQLHIANIKYVFVVVGIVLGCSGSVHAYQNGLNAPALDPQVWNVEINGNKTFPDILIEDIIATEASTTWQKLSFWKHSGNEINETEIRRDVIRIRRYYERRGFPHVQVKYRIETGNKDWKRTVHFVIDENVPVVIREVSFSWNTKDQYQDYITSSRSFKRAKSQHQFQTGERYQSVEEPDIIGTFTDLLKNLGFAFAEVNIQTKIDTLQASASVDIEINPGPLTYVDEIDITGNKTVSKQYVIRETALKRAELFSQDKLQQAQREIFNHHLFRFATINIPEQQKDSTLKIEIDLRENSLRTVQVLGGVGTEDLLRGQVSWTHRNLFHKGHRLTALAQASFIEQSLNLDYLIPYTFNTKSSLILSPFAQHILERQIYELYRGGITNSFIYRHRKDLTGTVSYQLSRNLELSKKYDEALPDTTFEYNLSSFQLSGYYSPGFTSRGNQGWVVQPYAEFSGLFGAAAFSFQKFSIDIRHFTKLTNTTTLATRLQTGGIFDVDQDSLPQNIRYYLGGTSSVRGWSRNELGPKRARFDSTGAFNTYAPVGGQAKMGFNIEIRQDLNSFINGLGMAVFLDGGQIWRRIDDIGDRSVQYAVGGGVRYRSPIGPIRIDVGYKLNPTDEDLNIYNGIDHGGKFDRIGIHFSVGQAF